MPGPGLFYLHRNDRWGFDAAYELAAYTIGVAVFAHPFVQGCGASAGRFRRWCTVQR